MGVDRVTGRLGAIGHRRRFGEVAAELLGLALGLIASTFF
jgi:hypothetical protein